MSYSDEFFNVSGPNTIMIAPAPARSLAAVDVTRLLQAAINFLSQPTIGQGTLYFPPGRYTFGALDGGSFVIPRNITLKFAPGAILVPGVVARQDTTTGTNPSLIIQGAIDAGIQQIFLLNPEVAVRPVPTDNPPAFNPRPTGFVRIDSLDVPVIRPEWWGAGLVPLREQEQPEPDTMPIQWRSFAPLNRAALQMALNVAWRYRVLRGLPPIPVELTGAYILSGEVTVREPTMPAGLPPPGPLVIRSTQAFGNTSQVQPSLVATGLGFTGSSLLHLEGSFDFLLENLLFDGDFFYESGPRAPRCVTVDRPSPNPSTARGVFRKCGFAKAARQLVVLGTLPRAGSGRHDLGTLVFEGCGFHQQSQPSARLPADAEVPDGVVFRASETTCLHFEECQFGGVARAMIRAFGGYFLITACTFHCNPLFEPIMMVGPMAPRLAARPAMGIDVFLDDPDAEVVDGVRTLIAPGAFYARSVESQSQALLHTFVPQRLPAAQARGRDVVLESVIAGFATNEPAVHREPEVRWSGPASHGANLILIGCRFRGGLDTGPLSDRGIGRVEIGPWLTSEARVLDLGASDQVNGGALVIVASAAPGADRTPVDLTRPPSWLLQLPGT